MALFGKKEGKASDAEIRAAARAAREAAERGEDKDPVRAAEEAEMDAHLSSVAAGGRKRSQLLQSVLQESVPAAALTRIRENTGFFIRDNDGEAALCMMLHAEDIGGLDAHTARSDPDKGQLIELINGQQMHVFVSDDLMSEDKILFIPDHATLEAMAEFQMLVDPNRFSQFYPTLVSWDETGEMSFDEYTDAPQNYDWFADIFEGKLSLEDACSQIGLYESGDDVPGMSSPQPPGEAAAREYEDDWDEADPAQAPGNFDTDPGAGYGEPDPYLPPPSTATPDGISMNVDQIRCGRCGSVCPATGCQKCGWVPGEDPDLMDFEEDLEPAITEELSQHIFYKDDLDLGVTAEPFDLVFLSRDDFVPLDDVRGSGLVAEHATQVIRNANEELRALHRANLDMLRRRFLTVMGKKCSDIAAATDMSPDSKTQYGNARASAERDLDDRLAGIPAEVEKRRAELREGWERERSAYADTAAAKARQDYDDRNRRAHQDVLSRVRSTLEDASRREYDRDIRRINDLRREAAMSQMNRYIQETLDELREDYERMLADEARRRDEKLQEIREYVNQNMVYEEARTNSMNRQLEDNAKADAIHREMEQRLSAKQLEHEMLRSTLEAKISEANATTATVRETYDARLAEAQRNAADMAAQLDALMEKYADLRKETEAEIHDQYESRVKTLTNDKISAQEHLAHVERMYASMDEARQRSGRLKTAAWVAGLVAAIAVGFVAGGLLYPAQPLKADMAVGQQALASVQDPLPPAAPAPAPVPEETEKEEEEKAPESEAPDTDAEGEEKDKDNEEKDTETEDN